MPRRSKRTKLDSDKQLDQPNATESDRQIEFKRLSMELVHLRKQLRYIRLLVTESIETIEYKQEHLNELLIGSSQQQDTSEMQLTTSGRYFAGSFFKDKNGMYPPPNQDVIEKRRKREVNHMGTGKTWTPVQIDMLKKIVYAEGASSYLTELKKQRNELADKLDAIDSTDQKNTSLATDFEQLEKLNKKISDLSQSFEYLSLDECFDKIDWLRVAAQMKTDHDYLDCKLMYCNYLHQSISHLDFGSEECERERRKILELVTEHGYNWDLIAQKLNSGRVAWQVAMCYQVHLNPDNKKSGPLSEAERLLVDGLVKQLQLPNGYIPWPKLKYFIEGRTVPQLKLYWSKRTAQKQGMKWTHLEDKVLLACVKLHGEKWVEAAKIIYGRTNRQCRERYKLRIGLNERKIGLWTKEEDRKLVTLAKEKQFKWKLVAKEMPNRNARQLGSRYDQLAKWYKANQETGSEEPLSAKTKMHTSKLPNTKTKLEKELEGELADLRKKLRTQYPGQNFTEKQLLEQYITKGRDQIKEAFEISQGRTSQYDKISKVLTKIKKEERTIDDEIIDMFMYYNEIKTEPTKCISLSEQDQIISTSVESIIRSQGVNERNVPASALDEIIRTLVDEHVLPKPKISSLPSIVPPNRISMKAFQALMLQRDLLARNLVDSAPELNIGVNSLWHIQNSPQFKQLLRTFHSVFFWPAVFSTVEPPSIEDTPNQPSKKDKPKMKRDALKKARQENVKLITQVRDAQRILIQSVSQQVTLRQLFEQFTSVRSEEVQNAKKRRWERDNYNPKDRSGDLKV